MQYGLILLYYIHYGVIISISFHFFRNIFMFIHAKSAFYVYKASSNMYLFKLKSGFQTRIGYLFCAYKQ